MHKKDNFPRRWSTYVLLLLQEDVNTERAPPLDDMYSNVQGHRRRRCSRVFRIRVEILGILGGLFTKPELISDCLYDRSCSSMAQW